MSYIFLSFFSSSCVLPAEYLNLQIVPDLAEEFGKRMDACTRICLRTFLYLSAFPLVPWSENLVLLGDAKGLDSELS